MPRQPTVRLRRLAAQLRRLREEAGLTQEDVADETGVSVPTLRRLERAHVRPRRAAVQVLIRLYTQDDAERTRLLDLYKASDQPGWLARYQDVLTGEYPNYISFETEARSVQNYQSLFIPGILQTEDYARAVIAAGEPGLSENEVQRRVEARIERQATLQKLQLWIILDEAAIRRQVGGTDVMRSQLDRLRSDAKLPNVTLQIIPFANGAHAGMPSSFVILEFSEPTYPPVVYIDSMAGDLFLEEEDDVARFKTMFDHLRASALPPDRSLDFVNST